MTICCVYQVGLGGVSGAPTYLYPPNLSPHCDQNIWNKANKASKKETRGPQTSTIFLKNPSLNAYLQVEHDRKWSVSVNEAPGEKKQKGKGRKNQLQFNSLICCSALFS